MGKRFHYEHLFQRKALDLYLKFSVLSAIFIGAMAVATRESSFNDWSFALMDHPMTSVFLALNFYIALETRPFRDSVPIDHNWGGFFLLQFFMVLALGIEHSCLEFFYMATMPIMAFLFSLQSDWFTSAENKKKRATLVMGITLFSLSGALYHPDFRSQWPEAVIILMTFGVWQWGTLYLANIEWIRLSRQTLREHLKKTKSGQYDIHPVTSERYFFHDLINHTHGVQLFLRGRLRKGSGLSVEEVKSLSHEVEAMQNLIRDHFGLSHKNLVPASHWREFSELKSLVLSIAESFLPQDKVDFYINTKGTLSPQSLFIFKQEGVEEPVLPSVAFHRILTNLIKNCSEASSRKVELCFEGFQDHVVLTLKNDVFKERDYGYELGKTLENIIHESSHHELKGLGLESIENLCRSIGGEFHFYIRDGHWVSEVKIPFRDTIPLSVSNLLESQEKKAA